ncbi:hypothetical protein M413DRAFT_398133 [Hebeloma cylindrosporum]|uniref:Uncharacterized protein n=1 Tax=Hebeloma cylindrosporum TaxID=76867 RepID=A0A0C3C2S3_HEBCY|nr:hypothetical protein M413DRAFT_398133 [Hebeloma cylindrosporum h7]
MVSNSSVDPEYKAFGVSQPEVDCKRVRPRFDSPGNLKQRHLDRTSVDIMEVRMGELKLAGIMAFRRDLEAT